MGTMVPLSRTSVILPVGDRWLLHVQVTDLDADAVDAAPTVTVTRPDGSTTAPTVETVTIGEYRTTYELAAAGRHFASVDSDGYGLVNFTAWAVTVTGTAFPTVVDVDDYLGDNNSWTVDELQDALDAEAAAQRARCKIPAHYPPDLREALLRRVQRNLAMRQLPLAIPQSDAEGGPTVLPGSDPEVRRLERPYPRLVMG